MQSTNLRMSLLVGLAVVIHALRNLNFNPVHHDCTNGVCGRDSQVKNHFRQLLREQEVLSVLRCVVILQHLVDIEAKVHSWAKRCDGPNYENHLSTPALPCFIGQSTRLSECSHVLADKVDFVDDECCKIEEYDWLDRVRYLDSVIAASKLYCARPADNLSRSDHSEDYVKLDQAEPAELAQFRLPQELNDEPDKDVAEE